MDDSYTTALAAYSARIVRFPISRSIGALYVRNVGQCWEPYGTAQGLVPVAANKELLLVCQCRSAPLDAMRELGPHDLDALVLFSPNIYQTLSYARELTGIRELELWRCTGSREGLPHVVDFHHLRSLQIAETLLDQGLLAHLIVSPSLVDLRLTNCLLTDDVFGSFRHFHQLRSLDVYSGPLCQDSEADVKTQNADPSPSLKSSPVVASGCVPAYTSAGVR